MKALRPQPPEEKKKIESQTLSFSLTGLAGLKTLYVHSFDVVHMLAFLDFGVKMMLSAYASKPNITSIFSPLTFCDGKYEHGSTNRRWSLKKETNRAP
jgi:hypothetical protein